MIGIMTIVGIMALMYVLLMINSCVKAEKKKLMRFEDLVWSRDNDGRKVAFAKLNEVYSVNVMEFSEDGIVFYIVNIRKDGIYHNSADYCTQNEVSTIMEKLQTIDY